MRCARRRSRGTAFLLCLERSRITRTSSSSTPTFSKRPSHRRYRSTSSLLAWQTIQPHHHNTRAPSHLASHDEIHFRRNPSLLIEQSASIVDTTTPTTRIHHGSPTRVFHFPHTTITLELFIFTAEQGWYGAMGVWNRRRCLLITTTAHERRSIRGGVR